MAAKTATYSLISSVTLSTTASTVSFTSIPGTFTDLIIVSSAVVVDGAPSLRFRFNSDSSTNYSTTVLSGSGTVAGSVRELNSTSGYAGNAQISTTSGGYNSITHIMDYSNSTTFKTVIERSNNASVHVMASVSLWRSTSAITRIDLAAGGSFPANNLASGSTFKLYGIEAGNL